MPILLALLKIIGHKTIENFNFDADLGVLSQEDERY